MKIYDYKDFSAAPAIKDADKRKGIVTGYFAAFNNKDADGDVILKGAFTRTISEQGPASSKPRIKHLQNHDITKPVGKLLVLQEDDKGLYYESQVGSHTLGQDFIKMVDSGLVTEHSIGFKTINEKKSDDDETNYLTELRLWEGSSLTGWGSNFETPITGMKGLNKTELITQLEKRSQALDSFCRNTTASDETIEMLLNYKDQLLQVISDFSEITEPDGATTHTHEPGPSLKISTLPSTVICPKCKAVTHNTFEEKGFIKCHKCKGVFSFGAKNPNEVLDIF